MLSFGLISKIKLNTDLCQATFCSGIFAPCYNADLAPSYTLIRSLAKLTLMFRVIPSDMAKDVA
jgi:hypothetical protein